MQQMKILGTTIDNKLNWDKNTDEIIKKVNKRMLLLKKIKSFGASPSDMVDLWKIYCRSILEQSAVVWGSSLSQKNKSDLERTQKSFLKLILKNKYKNYEDSLLLLNLENLEKRRQSLSLKFAKDCIKYKKFGNMFPLNDFSGKTQTRNMEKYKVPHTNTERMKKSPIPYMIDLLNKENNN